MKNALLSGTYMLWILACSTGTRSDTYAENSKTAAPAMEESMGSGGQQAPGTINLQEQKLIRNGNMSITVKNAADTRQSLNAILEKNKAYVGNEQLNNTDYQTVYTIQIRVPADHLDALVSDIEGLAGTVTFKSIQARDVTEEYIDLETRLTNKKAYLEQYRTLLKSAKSIEDILKVQEQIRVLEEEIESVTGRLKYLTNQVDLSTLELTITETKDFVYRSEKRINFFERLKQSMSTGWYGFISFIIYVFALWPFWLIVFFVLLGIRSWHRRQQKQKSKIPPLN